MYKEDRYRWLLEQANALQAAELAEADGQNIAAFLLQQREGIRKDFIDRIRYSLCRELVRWLGNADYVERDDYFSRELLPCYLQYIENEFLVPNPSLLDEAEECWRIAWEESARRFNRREHKEAMPLAPLWPFSKMMEPPTAETAAFYRQLYEQHQSKLRPAKLN